MRIDAIASRCLVLLAALAAIAGPRPASAGANEGGVLILHCNQGLVFTAETGFNGYAGLEDCRNAVTQVPGDGEGVVYFVLAAFDEFAAPQVMGVDFGIELSSPTAEPARWGVSGSGEPFYVADDSWPGSGTGIGITWMEPLNRRLNEICWFAGYADSGQTVKLTRHPLHGGNFVDNGWPRETDPIVGFGRLGFGVAGFNPCTGEETTGACCVGVDCRLLVQDECLVAGGVFMGEDATCEPSPCNVAGLALAASPNPLRTSTTFRLDLPVPGRTRLEIRDAAGRLVRPLVDRDVSAGPHVYTWDGRDSGGREAASGVYFVRASTPSGWAKLKLILAR
jgi:hypothetical protein